MARALMTGENSKLYYVRVAVSVANGMNVKEKRSHGTGKKYFHITIKPLSLCLMRRVKLCVFVKIFL